MAKKSLARTTISIGANIAGLQRGLKTASASIKRFGGQAKRIGTTFTAAFSAPITAIGVSAVKTFQGFEAEMSKVKAVSGATAEQFAKLESEAKRLGATTTFTASEVAGLQVEFAKLGFTASEITQVTESTLYLAQAAGTDLARAAEVAGATLRGFGMDASETGHLTDVMAKSFSESALDMESFAEAMKYVAPVASSAGISVEETTAMIELLANAGIKGSQAGTSLRRIISQLGATGGDVAGAIAKLSKEGLNLADAKDEVGRSAQSALLVLSKTIDQLPALTQGLKNADGAAKDMAATMMDNTAGAFKTLQSATEGALIELGDAIANNEIFKRGLEKLTEVIGNITEYIRGMSDAQLYNKTLLAGLIALVPIVITAVGGLTLAFGSLTAAMGPLGLAVAGVVLAYKALKKEVSESDAAIEKAMKGEATKESVKALKERNKEIKEDLDFIRKRLAVHPQNKKYLEAEAELLKEQKKIKEALAAVEEQRQKKLDGFRNAQKEYEAEQRQQNETTKETVEVTEDLGNSLGDVTEELEDIVLLSDDAGEALSGLADKFDDGDEPAEDFAGNLAKINKQRQRLQEGMLTLGNIFQQAFEAGLTSGDEFFKTLGKAFLDLTKRILATALAALALAAILTVIFGSAGVAGVKAFGTDFSGGFKDLTIGIAKTMGGIPMLAEGGIVNKPTLAMIGEGGESEAVIPLSKLPQIAGAGGAVTVVGKISGQDILLSSEKANRTRSRYRGF